MRQSLIDAGIDGDRIQLKPANEFYDLQDKETIKKIEDIMKKVMFINKTIAITNKGYSGEKHSCQNTLEQTASAVRPIKY